MENNNPKAEQIQIGEEPPMGIANGDIAALSLIAEGNMIVTAHPDGRVEFGENISIDEGKQFYCMLKTFWAISSGNLVKR